ncbi:hypothetical protein [Priestia filamentosa]|uniref:hypothetical protein n=1 Tax=Priestia filamentosa TaxID=1402861 RepID=UPI0002EA163A|nr:hypothetical protein [Priestia filamentosa]
MNNSKRQFIEIENTTEETRSIIYDVFATYNIILQDHRRFPAFDMIQQEYNHLKLPILNDKDFGPKLKSELEQSLNVSFNDVIKTCEHDQIFMDLINFLER